LRRVIEGSKSCIRLECVEAVLLEVPFNRDIANALRLVNRTQVPDLPDRIIAATALHLRVPVISRDSKIQLSSVNTIW
jgi:predicted nucleic acid-binding protein